MTARWRTLNPEATPVSESDISDFFRVLIVPENEASNVPVTHDFSESFERPSFTGTIK